MRSKGDGSRDVAGDRDFSSGLGEIGWSAESNEPGCELQPGSDRHIDQLIDLLCGTNPETRLEAAATLAKEADARALPQLLRGITHADPAVRHATLVLIRNLNHTANVRRDADLRVALEASEIVTALARCLHDEHPLNVVAANVALSCIASPAAKNYLKAWRYEKTDTGPLQ